MKCQVEREKEKGEKCKGREEKRETSEAKGKSKQERRVSKKRGENRVRRWKVEIKTREQREHGTVGEDEIQTNPTRKRLWSSRMTLVRCC